MCIYTVQIIFKHWSPIYIICMDSDHFSRLVTFKIAVCRWHFLMAWRLRDFYKVHFRSRKCGNEPWENYAIKWRKSIIYYFIISGMFHLLVCAIFFSHAFINWWSMTFWQYNKIGWSGRQNLTPFLLTDLRFSLNYQHPPSC